MRNIVIVDRIEDAQAGMNRLGHLFFSEKFLRGVQRQRLHGDNVRTPNMGGGIPIFFFSAAAFIILAYKNAGNDIDAELVKIATPSILDEDNI